MKLQANVSTLSNLIPARMMRMIGGEAKCGQGVVILMQCRGKIGAHNPDPCFIAFEMFLA